ncbi:hypothetical protein B0W44_06115 [Novibacillus thermophilus]|uniref:Uncharacterized protein n=1 Tax=Novibacillus thermophilus TaxID=1471761 RepID=A0A1U9K5W0_9BACL|nr:hypothetical protein B0W44_06115 [Novibacillus thermophilus]
MPLFNLQDSFLTVDHHRKCSFFGNSFEKQNITEKKKQKIDGKNLSCAGFPPVLERLFLR